MKDWLDAFWIWFGKQAAEGRVVAGDKEQATELMEAFHAGWDAYRDEARKAEGPG